jgi:hypothetical protein
MSDESAKLKGLYDTIAQEGKDALAAKRADFDN